MANLYDINERYKNLEMLLNDPEIPIEVIQSALEEVAQEFEDKADNIVRFIKSLEGDCKAIKEEEVRLASRRRVLENKITGLKKYLEEAMNFNGRTTFKTPYFSYNIQNNPPALDISSEDNIPAEFVTYETVKHIDKKGLLKAIKDGLEVDGCSIRVGKSLRIR